MKTPTQENKRRWHLSHKEQERASAMRWRRENPEKWKALKRASYHRVRARMTEEQKAEKRIRFNLWSRERFERNPCVQIVNVARKRARKQGLECDLTKEWAKVNWTGKCAISGAQFVLCKGRPNSFSPSLDRIDPSKGYLQSNCRFILWAINRFKGEEGDDVMMRIAHLLVGH